MFEREQQHLEVRPNSRWPWEDSLRRAGMWVEAETQTSLHIQVYNECKKGWNLISPLIFSTFFLHILAFCVAVFCWTFGKSHQPSCLLETSGVKPWNIDCIKEEDWILNVQAQNHEVSTVKAQHESQYRPGPTCLGHRYFSLCCF